MAIVVLTDELEPLTYGTLLSDIARWMARDDLADEIQRFVRLAESDLCADLRIRAQETTQTYSATGSPLTLPDGFLGMRSLTLNVTGASRGIDFMPPERLLVSRLDEQSGNPVAYTIVGSNIILAPAGSAESPVEVTMHYIKALDSLVTTPDTNEVLSKFYDLYLYAALKHGFSFLRDDAQAAKYKAEYDEKMAKVLRNANRERWHGNRKIRTGGVSP